MHRCRNVVVSLALAAALSVVFFSAPPAGAVVRIDEEKATQQLFQAVHGNDIAAVQQSVRDGADVEAHDRWGMTPTDIAVDRGYYRIAHFLVSVRNGRRAAPAERPAPIAPPVAAAEVSPLPLRASPLPSSARSVPPGSAASPAVVESLPLSAGASAGMHAATTAGRGHPNPFDPVTPAFGAQLRPGTLTTTP